MNNDNNLNHLSCNQIIYSVNPSSERCLSLFFYNLHVHVKLCLIFIFALL